MKFDSLVRLIESADYMSFREIAHLALQARSFKHVAITDGWKDGGRDVAVYEAPPNPSRFAVQLSVERDWRGKLREDAGKVRSRLGVDVLLYVTSRRVPEADFATVADEIWVANSVTARKMDSQAIATLVMERGLVSDVFTALGIQAIATPSKTASTREVLRQDIAYAFAFFGEDPSNFRRTIIEDAILEILSDHPKAVSRDQVIAETISILGLAPAQEQLVTGALDRLIQDRRIERVEAAQFTVNEVTRQAAVAVRTLRERDWVQLQTQVSEIIVANIPTRKLSEAQLSEIMEALGALIITTGSSTKDSVGQQVQHSVILRTVRERLRALHAVLDRLGAPDADRDTLLQVLTRTAMDSSIGKHLVAGEVFIGLSSMTTPALIRALGAKSDLTVVLDSSVAIPILAGLLYEPTADRFSLASTAAFNQLRVHELRAILPRDYLEETASHLLVAYRDYAAIIYAEPDLRASTNAFVAHFSSLYRAGKVNNFVSYLEAFGFREHIARGEFYGARNIIMQRLKTQFQRYGISCDLVPRPSSESRERAERAVAYAQDERGVDRQAVLLRHDVRTIAFLHDQDAGLNETYILCTWDNLHFYVREFEAGTSPRWDVLNPAFLGDMLSLAAPHDETRAMVSPVVVAMSMADEDAQRGAAVWDALAGLEQGNFYDAELLRRASAFKQEFLATHAEAIRYQDVRDAWTKWKEGVQE